MDPFLESLNLWGDRFVAFAVPMLVQSSLLILLLFALDLLLRKRVRAVVRCALWMLVLIKLVLPPSFAAPTGLAYWLPQKKAVRTPPAPSPQFVVRYSDIQFDAAPVLPSLPPPRPQLQFAGWLLLGWLTTALGLMAWLVRRSSSVVQTAARALPAPESPEQLLGFCLQQMGIKQRVRLKLSATAGSPAVCGLWRPVILIPQQLADKLSALQLRAVLLHELAHIKRGDVWVHYAQTLLQIFYWWHPLLWLANAQIRRVREQAVDEMVMVHMGVEAEAYPATLLEVAKLAFKRPMLALGLIGIVESKSALTQRIHQMINRPVPKSARLGFTGLAALFLAGAAFLPMARGQRTPYQAPRVASEPAPVVAMDVKFIEIEESVLAALGLGEPPVTEFNGHRAWALSSEQLNGVLQRALEQAGTDVLTAPRVTTVSGRQTQIQVVDISPVVETEIRVGPTCDLTPYVTGDLIDLSVAATVTERKPVDPTAPFTSVADALLTNDVGTARVLVGNGGGVVLENPEARSSKGNRYLVMVSATIVSDDRAAESPTLDQASTAAAGAASQKQEVPVGTFQSTTRTRPTKSERVRPTDATTKGDASAGEREPLTVTIAKTEPHLYIGSESVTIEELKTRLQRAASRNPAVTLWLRADTDAPFREIVKVTDTAKEAGIKSISMFTRPQPTNTLTNREGQGTTKRFALSAGQEVEIEATKPGEIQYDHESGICVVTNDFVARFNGAVLTARRCEVNAKTGEVIAEGDVILRRGDQVLWCERLHYNSIDQKITVEKITVINASSRAASSNGSAQPAVENNVVPIPATNGDARAGEGEPLTVTIAKTEPHLYIGSESVTVEELKTRLQRAVSRNPAVTLSLRADTDAPFGEIVKVTDAAKEAGIKSISAFTPPQNSTAATIETAKQLFELGQFDAAERKLRDLLKTDPENQAAKYYLGLVRESRAETERRRAKFGLWYPTIPPRPAGSPKPDDLGRSGIQSRLHRIVLPELAFDSVSLPNVLQWLSKQALESDPQGKGINFIFNPNVIQTTPRTTMEPTTVDPITGKPITLPLREALDINTVIVHIKPPLRNVRLADAIEAIVKMADKPIRYTIEDYAVVISQRLPASEQLETRIFKVNPEGLIQHLQNNSAGLTNTWELLRGFFTAAGVNVAPPNMMFYKDRTGMLMVRATVEELERVQAAIDALNAVQQNKSGGNPRANSPANERTANADADKDTGNAAESAAWARTYVGGGFRLKLDADGTYLASLDEDGVRRSERGTWKKHGREFVLERQAGDLQYAIRRLRVDEKHPTHLLWVPEVSNLSGAIEYFSFKPDDESPSTSGSKDLGFDWFLGNTLASNDPLGSQGGTAAPQENKTKPVSSPTPLETRFFRVNPATFREGLKRTSGVPALSRDTPEAILRKQLDRENIDSVQDPIRSFFTAVGVDVHPPNMVFLNDRTGVLMVRATAKELDIVQEAIDTLTLTAPRQILIETRFIEAPTDFLRKAGLDAIQARPGEQGWARVFTTAEARALLQATTKTAGVDVLSGPRVTTLEGRQTQIQAGEVQAVATDINPQAKNAPGLTSTDGVEPSPYLTSSVTLGASLDIIPEVAEDGYTLRVLALPTVTEFLGYDGERAEATKTRVWIDGKEQALAPPVPIFRTRQMQATANLYDGQTLVLGGAVPVVTTERSNGKSEAKTVAEDDTKRLLVVVTPVLIDPAGNPIHAPGKEPFPIDKVPTQPLR